MPAEASKDSAATTTPLTQGDYAIRCGNAVVMMDTGYIVALTDGGSRWSATGWFLEVSPDSPDTRILFNDGVSYLGGRPIGWRKEDNYVSGKEGEAIELGQERQQWKMKGTGVENHYTVSDVEEKLFWTVNISRDSPPFIYLAPFEDKPQQKFRITQRGSAFDDEEDEDDE